MSGYNQGDLVTVENPDKYNCLEGKPYVVCRTSDTDADLVMEGDTRGGAIRSALLSDLRKLDIK